MAAIRYIIVILVPYLLALSACNAPLETRKEKERPPADQNNDKGDRRPIPSDSPKESNDVSGKKYLQLDEEKLKGVARTRFDSPEPTKAQLDRRAKNNAAIKKMGLPVLDTLPVVEDVSTVKSRSAEEVAKRCLATAICSVKGETNDQELVEKVLKDYAAEKLLSPEEKKFFEDKKPTKQNLIDFAWRYECAHVFLWAMKLREDIMPPNEICMVADDMGLIWKARNDFVPKAKIRSMDEILDMADLYYRLHWAAIELRIKGKKSDAIDEGIIRERHRALNWLIRYLNQEWDDVTTDT